MEINIRKAVPDDAPKIIEYMNALLQNSESYLEMSRGEFKHTVEEEKSFLDYAGKSGNSVFLLAEDDGEIVGSLVCVGSERIKTKHNTMLGITVKEEYRNKGIGSRLLEFAINWAKETGVVKRIELHVFNTNGRAIHLYKKYGFTIEGEKQKAIKINDEYINEIIMALHI